MRLGYLIVEGPHDVAFLGKLLRFYGFGPPVKMRPDLNTFWRPLTNLTFPHNEDLLKRMPIPQFFQSSTHSVAIHQADGETEIIRCLQGSLAALDDWNSKLVGIGLMLDTDAKPPAQKMQRLLGRIAADAELPRFPTLPGQVSRVDKQSLHSGVFLLPDNHSEGTVEDLLLNAAEHSYPKLLGAANNYVSDVKKLDGLDSSEFKTFRTPAGTKKATLASIGSILKPGKAIQMSIQDNRWLEGPILTEPRIRAVMQFLEQLLDLPSQVSSVMEPGIDKIVVR